MAVLVSKPPCIVHEDDDLLVVNKPAGLNTHSPSPFAGEGIYEWLRNRESAWAHLGTVHRLDKATSGLLVFAKSKLANKSLTEQFLRREVRKRYLLLTAHRPATQKWIVRAGLVRTGEKYTASPHGDFAETHFEYIGPERGHYLVAAEPVTGRTHQIRAHCELKGIPILGDLPYGGGKFERVCLHSEKLALRHPATGQLMELATRPDFFSESALALRNAMIEGPATNACRLIHGGSDGRPYYLERWGDCLLVLSDSQLSADQVAQLKLQMPAIACRSLYFKLLNRQVARTSQQEAAPQLIAGLPAPPTFAVRENGVEFEISFEQGYSVGLFLDQRENRRRLLTNHVSADFDLAPGGLAGRRVLNTFAYTCGFSLCAALGGAVTTSVDLSRKYLEWGQRNFRRNQIDPTTHEFIYGDVFDWADRFRKRSRLFDLILLDPPTFSRSKNSVFQAERDYPALITAVLPLLSDGGVLFASTNAHKLAPEEFVLRLQQTITKLGKKVVQMHYVPQPIDFPISKEEPAYLKTLWMRISG